jgi:CRP-like cAMP-binding protein
MALEKEILDLQRNALLGLFDIEALRLIAFSTDERSLRKDDILFRHGEPADGGYFVHEGSLALMADDVEQIHPVGSLLGETALFAETQRPATAVALENLRVRRIPRHLIRRVLAEFPETANRVQVYMAGKLTDLGERLHRLDRLLPNENGPA